MKKVEWKRIFILINIIFVLSIFFSIRPGIKDFNVSPTNRFYNDYNFQQADDVESDRTKIIFKYNNKVWEYIVEDLEYEHSNFFIKQNKNKYKSNNKTNKINLINKLIKLNYNSETIIKYIFPNLMKIIEKIEKNIEITPKNARYIINKDSNNIIYYNEIKGIKINKKQLILNIINNYCESKNNDDVIKIKVPYQIIEPTMKVKDLKKSVTLRSCFSTSFKTSTKDRKHNIYRATSLINNTIISPNQKFSFNKTVGRRSYENGFRQAKIIVNGEFVEGVGGGVCQVSSTLYNAILLAGLKVNQSHKHSKPISYVQSGFDAMVNFGSGDLVFTNNTNENIIISAYCKNNKVTICLYGEDSGQKSYKLVSVKSNIIEPTKESIIYDNEGKYLDKIKYEDESFYLRQAMSGYTVKTYRETYVNNVCTYKELLRVDKFDPQSAIKVCGVLKKLKDDNDI